MFIKRILAYFNLIFPYFIPALLFMAAFLVIYPQSEDQIKKTTVEQTLVSLKTAVAYIDSSFLSAYSILEVLLSNRI